MNTLNNYSVAADRVAVAAELDKFSRNMNDPTNDGCCGIHRQHRDRCDREWSRPLPNGLHGVLRLSSV